MSVQTSINRDVLNIDAAQVANHITASIQTIVSRQLRRRGIVVGLSGGIDSSVVAALCARALGSDRVLGLLMPESESADESLSLGQLVADSLNVRTQVENIGPMLEAAGCYRRRDSAIRLAVPEYGPGHKSKVVLANVLDTAAYQVSYLVVQSLDGQQKRVRLNAEAYLSTIAANNFKQRTRKMIEYYHADRLNYAVAGTPNRLEYDQGFFVKNGDGAADIKPMRQDRLRLVKKLDEMISFAPRDWPPLEWPRYRTKMIRHAYIEASEEAFEHADYWKAIAYSLRHAGGLSAKTGMLMLRSLYRMGRSAVGVGH